MRLVKGDFSPLMCAVSIYFETKCAVTPMVEWLRVAISRLSRDEMFFVNDIAERCALMNVSECKSFLRANHSLHVERTFSKLIEHRILSIEDDRVRVHFIAQKDIEESITESWMKAWGLT